MLEQGIQQKIVTVALNPAYDYILALSNLKLGTLCRAKEEALQPAGKGVNVAYYLAFMGMKVTVTGFLGNNKDLFESFFRENSITNACVSVAGKIRTNITLLEMNNITNINVMDCLEILPHWQDFLNIIKQLAQSNDIFVLSGILPKDAPINGYSALIELLKSLDKKVFLDTSGIALQQAVRAKPYFIKPNENELKDLLGKKTLSENELIQGAKDLQKSGIEVVCVSIGHKGIIAVDSNSVYKAIPSRINARCTVGAGDAFVSGFVLAIAQGKDVSLAIRLGMAMAQVSVTMVGARLPNKDIVMEKYNQTQIIEEKNYA